MSCAPLALLKSAACSSEASQCSVHIVVPSARAMQYSCVFVLHYFFSILALARRRSAPCTSLFPVRELSSKAVVCFYLFIDLFSICFQCLLLRGVAVCSSEASQCSGDTDVRRVLYLSLTPRAHTHTHTNNIYTYKYHILYINSSTNICMLK